jgi:hypothetical protein
MAAAPFSGVISLQGLSGNQYVEPFTCTDVANAFVTFDSSGLSFLQLPEPATIVDIVEHTGGTDTTKTRVWVNNRDTGITWRNTAILDTINNRVPLPIKVGNPRTGGGVQLQLKQLA